jgi:mercuric ion transport protein
MAPERAPTRMHPERDPRIELVFYPGCANLQLARARLTAALAAVGLPAQWLEWDRENSSSPGYARQFGSPTILVNGSDVAGESGTGLDASTCRIYWCAEGQSGVPPVPLIVDAIRRSFLTPPSR